MFFGALHLDNYFAIQLVTQIDKKLQVNKRPVLLKSEVESNIKRQRDETV